MGKDIGRLALRAEGDFWIAYYAKADTMKDSLFLGSIALAFVQNPERKKAFIDLMTQAVGEILAGGLGQMPRWKSPRPAPFWERKDS